MRSMPLSPSIRVPCDGSKAQPWPCHCLAEAPPGLPTAPPGSQGLCLLASVWLDLLIPTGPASKPSFTQMPLLGLMAGRVLPFQRLGVPTNSRSLWPHRLINGGLSLTPTPSTDWFKRFPEPLCRLNEIIQVKGLAQGLPGPRSALMKVNCCYYDDDDDDCIKPTP